MSFLLLLGLGLMPCMLTQAIDKADCLSTSFYVQLKNLKETFDNQTETLAQMIRDQTKVIEDQAEVNRNQSEVIEELRALLEERNSSKVLSKVNSAMDTFEEQLNQQVEYATSKPRGVNR